jgi:hypothetical protein
MKTEVQALELSRRVREEAYGLLTGFERALVVIYTYVVEQVLNLLPSERNELFDVIVSDLILGRLPMRWTTTVDHFNRGGVDYYNAITNCSSRRVQKLLDELRDTLKELKVNRIHVEV